MFDKINQFVKFDTTPASQFRDQLHAVNNEAGIICFNILIFKADRENYKVK